MRNLALAEWILASFGDRERATCIVGDLEETARSRGGFWFWRSVAGTALRLGWRSATVFVACMSVQVAIAGAVTGIMSQRLAVRPATTTLPPLEATLTLSAMLLASMAVFALFRYGVRDPTARLAGGLALAAFAGGCLQGAPAMTQAAVLVILVAVLASAVSSQGRRALAATAATFAVSAIVFFAELALNRLATRFSVGLRFPFNCMLVVAAQWAVLPRARGVNLISE